ncbi:hypothetical protein F383_38498 [Gossypium arboreum]|uniref:Uncharacterized protein n=1 Tax=Gossypium arboreum TaxID=29729 RepID=A0A0B0MGY8_GOSAR|nr:hypothetical protein F383_38498 [Gossypium arboreum]
MASASEMRASVRPCLGHGIGVDMCTTCKTISGTWHCVDICANVRPFLGHGICDDMCASVRPCLGHGIGTNMRLRIRPYLGYSVDMWIHCMMILNVLQYSRRFNRPFKILVKKWSNMSKNMWYM